MVRLPAFHDSAFNLGAARIIVFASLWYSLEVCAPAISVLSTLPHDLYYPPRIMKALVRAVPPSEELVTAGLWTLRVVAVCGLLGLWSRTMATLAFVLSTYLFGLMWCFGATGHKLHHLPMMLLVLSASRCGDALSIDAWMRRRRGTLRERSGFVYGLPLRVFAICFGLVYLFPGLWKVATEPTGWFTGDCLRVALWRDWTYQPAPMRIDEWPLVMPILGTLTVVYELLFLPLALWRRARPVLAVTGIMFHTGINVLMDIDFIALSMCLLVLVDWQAVSGWLRGSAWRRSPPARDRASPALDAWDHWTIFRVLFIAAVIWWFQIILGARDREEYWPISAYPSFAHMSNTVMVKTVVTVTPPGGMESELSHEPMKETFVGNWGGKVSTSVREAPHYAPLKQKQQRALLRFWARTLGHDPAVVTIRLYAVSSSARPEDWGKPPFERALLLELPPTDLGDEVR